MLYEAAERAISCSSSFVSISGAANSVCRVSLYIDSILLFILCTCSQFKIKPTIDALMSRIMMIQMVLIAVMAEGSLFMEMKFLKSFRFFMSSVYVLPVSYIIFISLSFLSSLSYFFTFIKGSFRLLTFLSKLTVLLGYTAINLSDIPKYRVERTLRTATSVYIPSLMLYYWSKSIISSLLEPGRLIMNSSFRLRVFKVMKT